METWLELIVALAESVRWPVFALAILASVVGSQAIISGTFSIINQSQSLSCFPRVKVIHTSDKIHGQIYIPEINWMLMILCLAVAIGFRDTKHMGNASGLAVMTVMLVTTCLTSLVIILCWHKPPVVALSFLLFFGSIELLYFSASLIKFLEGAWLPILLALFLMTTMFVWHYTTIQKYHFDLQNKVSLEWLLALGPSLGIARVPGIGLIYSDLVSGVPANFSRFVTNLPAFHRVLVFLCVKAVTVPHVPPEERYLVGRVGPPAHRSYRCIVRYGYRDVHQDTHSFESELVAKLADFIRIHGAGWSSFDQEPSDDGNLSVVRTSSVIHVAPAFEMEKSAFSSSFSEVIELEQMNRERKVRFILPESPQMDANLKELEDLSEAQQAGTAFILGHSHVKAKPGSSILRKAAIDVWYSFLRRNCRGPEVALRVPPVSMLEVGMMYVV